MKDKKSNRDFQGLSLFEKRGVCVYLHNLINIMAVLEKLFDLFEGKDAWDKGKKLSQEEYRIGDEVAAYFYFVTSSRIWGFHKWNLSEKDAYTVLDTVSIHLLNAFHIEKPNKRLKEYRNMAERGVESLLGHFAGEIIRLLGKDKRGRAKPIQIQEITRNQLTGPFLKGLGRISVLSELEMDATIKDYSVNFPRFLKI